MTARLSLRALFSGLALAVSLSMPAAIVRAQATPGAAAPARVPVASAKPLLLEADKAIRLRDPKRAVALWEQAAKLGDPEAEYHLGNAHRTGVGVEKDYARAARWYELAAQKRNANAQFALGSLYQYGRGVPVDRNRAMELFREAARAGHAEARSRLATFGRTRSVVAASGSARVAAGSGDVGQALAQAVRTSDLGAARDALARGASVVGPRDEQFPDPPLLDAIRRDAREIVELLLAHKADPNTPLESGETLLVHAVRVARPAIVQALLRAGARPDERLPNGSTALHEAARLGRIDVASDLLAGGASAKLVLDDGTSAADVARRFGHDRLATLLLQKGASSALASGADMAVRVGREAPTRAARGARPGELPAMVEAGRRGDVELIRKLLAAGNAVDVVDGEGDRALGRAAEGGHAAAVASLLASGADANAPDAQGATPLLRAAASTAPGAEAAVKSLLDAGADPNVRDGKGRGIAYYLAESATRAKVEALQAKAVSARNDELADAIVHAAAANQREGLEALLSLSSDPKVGTPALCGALTSGRSEAVEILLTRGVDASAPCEDGSRPLVVAARVGTESLVRRLLAAGADPSAASRSGDTPLIASASRGHAAVVKILLESGAVVDQRGETRLTALMAASANGHLEVVDILLAAGANPLNRDDSSRRAADLAKSAGHADVVERLRAGSGSSWRSWVGSSSTP